MTADPVFAQLQGVLTGNRAADQAVFTIAPDQFAFPSQRGLLLTITTGTRRVQLGQIQALGGAPRPQVLAMSGVTEIVHLNAGSYAITLRGHAGQAYQVSFSLTGDDTGDDRVDASDLAAIRSDFGEIFGKTSYAAALDVNHDGKIGPRDILMAEANSVAATSVQPLQVALQPVSPSSTSAQAIVITQSLPGDAVTFSQPGHPSATRIADTTGRVDFIAQLEPGSNPITVDSVDTFGQHVQKTMSLVRSPLRGQTASSLGAAFQPYVGQWSGTPPTASTPLFNSYGSGNDSVANQLTLIQPYVSKIATYGAGYASYYPPTQPWNQVDSNWQVGIDAAALNKSLNSPAIVVSQGIYQQTTPQLMTAEINGAFNIATTANATYPGTVTRLILTNEYVTDATTTEQVDQMINTYKTQAHNDGLQVGVRSNTFGQLTNPASPYLMQLQQLVKDCDFIMLNLYPFSETEGISGSVTDVANQYNSIKAAALALNPNIQVIIGETGWPSQGISFNDLDGTLNTVANEQAYFNAISTWAAQNSVETYFFEAIDEPWKSNQNQPLNQGNPWQGPNGAEGHYGIWTYSSSDQNGTFSAKFTPPPV